MKTEVALGDALDFVLGGEWGEPPGSNEPGLQDVLVVRGSDFRHWDERRASGAAHRRVAKSSLERRALRSGDIVLEVSGGGPTQPVGRVLLVDAQTLDAAPHPLICSNFCRMMRPKPGVNGAFLAWSLRREYQSGRVDRFQSQTTNLRNLSVPKYLEETTLSIPPLEDQHRIVAHLDACFQRTKRAKKALDEVPALLDRLRQSILAAAFRGDLTADWRAENPDVEPASELLKRIRVERRRRWEEAELAKMIAKGKAPKDDTWKAKYEEPEPVDERELPELPEGWCWASVEELCLVESGQTPKDIERLSSENGAISWFRVGDMNLAGNESELLTGGVLLSRDAAASVGLHVRPAGTIVFPKRGGAIATNKRRILARPSAYDLNLMGLVPARSVADYFAAWFEGIDLATLNDGAVIPQINHGDIAPLRVPIPSEPEMLQLVRLLGAARDRTRSVSRTAHGLQATIATLSTAILSEVFSAP